MKLRKITAALCAIAMAVSLAACGGGDTNTASAGKSAETKKTTEIAAADNPAVNEKSDKTTAAEETTAAEAETTSAGRKKLELPSGNDEFVDVGENDDYVYEIYTYHVQLRKYKGDSEEIVIPEELEGLPVTSVRSVFSKNKTIKRIVLPYGVTNIDTSAFCECTALEEVVILGELDVIEAWAFLGCTSLKSIELPETLREIGDSAFYKCTSLEELDIPESVESIGNGVFDGTPWLETAPSEINGIKIK